MIITRTPLRISLVGGGTDFKDFYSKDYGAVLSAAINKYIYVIIKERFDNNIRIGYSTTEIVEDPNDLKHELIKEAIKRVGLRGGIELTTMADIPSEGSGLGSSSSVTVGTLHALYAYQGKLVSAERLASEACEIEIDILGKPIGKQDQYAVAFGGVNTIDFHPTGGVLVSPLSLTQERLRSLEGNLLLFYTGKVRQASDILQEQKENIEDKRKVLQTMALQVKPLKELLESNRSIHLVGPFLEEAWLLKKKLANGITSNDINELHEKAKQNGALGGKIAGAGGGGFLLLLCPIANQDDLRIALNLKELPFQFDRDGTKVIFNTQN